MPKTMPKSTDKTGPTKSPYYKQHYRKEWENESCFKGWLTKAPENSEKKEAYCKVCPAFLAAQRKSLLDHGNSGKQKAACDREKEAVTLPKIDKFAKPRLIDSRKIAELKLAFFIAEHTSIKAIDYLSVLIKSLDKESSTLQDIQLHRTKCTALIKNDLSPSILEDLLQDIGNSFYSLIIDESTAIDKKKLLCLVIRYVSTKNQKVVTTLYRLIEMRSGTSDAITASILDQLKIDKLDVKNFLGLGVDGASVNVGSNHSVTTLLHEVNPNITIIKCICHSLHLAAEKACESLPRHLDFMIRETHNWFSHSTKRQLEYNELYNVINEKNSKKIPKLSDTRWLVREQSIHTVITQYDPLKLLFQLAETKEKCYTSSQLSMMFKAEENRFYLTFIHTILKPVIDLNTHFQSDKADPIKLFGDLNDLFYSILQKIVVPSQLKKVARTRLHSFDFSKYLMQHDCIDFGYEFNMISKSLDKEVANSIKLRCRQFLIDLARELQERIPLNIHILEKISFFSQDNASLHVKPDISEVAIYYKYVCVDIDETIRQWKLLHRAEVAHQDNVFDYWFEIAKLKNANGERKFDYICDLAFALLSLPVSNAAIERAFSIVNIVKDKLRNKLAVLMLEAILHVRCTSQIDCTQFMPTNAMLKRFNSENLYKDITESEIDVLDILPTE